MPIDDQTLTRLSRYEDPEAGIYEQFAAARLGPGRSLALLAGPLDGGHELAWAICPTVGPEHGNLRRLEALVARTLAAGGFASVRIRPDADAVHVDIDPARRAAELDAAVELLRAETGVEAVGLAGVLFGGTLAALAADRAGATALALIQPVTRGRQYGRELLRREAVAQLMAEEGAVPEGAMHDLETTGEASIRGLRLSREAFEAISAVKLVEELRFRGRALLVDISPGGGVSPGVHKLADRIGELGGEATVEPVQDPLYAPLGEYYYRDAGLLRVDTRLELDRRLADLVTAWAQTAVAPRSAAPVT